MIFITLGSQKFQFNRLLKALDDLVEEGAIQEEVFAQIGYSDYKPRNYEFKEFLDRDEFAEMEGKAEIVITNGGTGAIIGAPRLAKYGEHVDDHQLQLIEQFEKLNLICPCRKLENLRNALNIVKNTKYKKYISNTKIIIKNIEQFIEKEF